MCDELTEQDALNDARLMSRRGLGLLASSLGIVAAFPANAAALPFTERDVMVSTPDGKADCYFVAPSKGKHPAVLVWPDAYGLRPAFRQMGKRLAEAGYAVLVVNPFYRKAKAPVAPPGANFSDPAIRALLQPLMAALTPATNEIDAKAFVAFLDAQRSVDRKRKIGTTGYCMGGPITMRTAALLPARIGAGASFHGGGLATDKPESPHLLVPKMKANFLIAIAENDDQRDPKAKDLLRTAFDAAGRSAEIEVYAGTQHGWCPPDAKVYSEAQAERAWARMLALFEKNLV
jgi:carboxymethylenebutenolidase